VNTLQSTGWRLKGLVDIPDEWWFEGILRRVSNWRPVNTNLYLTLLTDPQILTKKVIWCIGISNILPYNRHFEYVDQLVLNHIKKTNLKEFVDRMNTKVLG
jgi:hypothetical protein